MYDFDNKKVTNKFACATVVPIRIVRYSPACSAVDLACDKMRSILKCMYFKYFYAQHAFSGKLQKLPFS